MKNPIFVISDDHSYLGVYRTPEDAESYQPPARLTIRHCSEAR